MRGALLGQFARALVGRADRRVVLAGFSEAHAADVTASASSAATRPSGVCGSASRSGSQPSPRSSALVAGPDRDQPRSVQRTTRGGEEAHGGGRGEEHVVGGAGGGAGRVVERLRHRLVERDDVDLGAALAQRVDQDVAPLGGAGDERARDTATSGAAPRPAPRPRRARARCRPRSRGRAARAPCPGRSRRRSRPASSRASRRWCEELVGAGRRGHAQQVVAAHVGERRRRAPACGSRAPRRPRRRARAAAPPARYACARARVTATVRPYSGRVSSHAICSRSAATGPTSVIAGARMPRRRARRSRRASTSTVFCPGSVPCSTTATGSSARPPAGDQLRRRSAAAPSRPCRRRACPGTPPARASRAPSRACPGSRGR